MSLAPVLRDPTRPVKNAAFSQYPRGVDGKQLMGYSMRIDRYRLTLWLHKNDHSKVEAVELYDHQSDPAENLNIASVPKNAALVKSLTDQLHRGWRSARQ